ncbi:MAG: T9SS type A sorting domain-containing protein [Candidatus Sabulitectum sp.]|nr:T9SS type A sorting domain-containing protein [Candidatus Sabulitectum sp.]
MSILFLSLISTVFYIGNQLVSVGVTDQTQTVRAGSVSYFKDNWTGVQIAGSGQFSGINSDTWIPADGDITAVNDTSLIFHTDHFTDGQSSLPLDLTVTYVVVDRGLEISYRFEYLQDVEFWDPLEIDFYIAGWDGIEISNQTVVDEVFPLNGSTGFQRFSGDQLFKLTDGDNPDAIFVLPNTAKGIAVVNDDGDNPYMSVRVLDTENPRENAMGPVLHSIVGAGQVDEYFIRFSMDEHFAPVFIGGHPEGAERSSAWMLDELTFVHPDQGYIWGFSETSSGDEAVSAGLISLLDTHQEMKMNWLLIPDAILTPNRDSVWFEPGYEDSWSHWHGTWRFPTEAAPEYLQWLRNIQDDVYPWADRVRMGSHGYHHTPNPDSSYGEYHEFITYEPLEHQERFRMVFQDLNACGLDTSLVRVLRYPGHRTSLSGLQAIIDHGFTFYCNGWRMIDWFAGKPFVNQWISRYQTPNGRIWGSNSVWWGDYQMMYPTEWLSEIMEKGKFGLLGCHPISMLAVSGGSWSPEAYARIDSILTSMETDYDNFLWLFPEEYGNYLEDCFNIRVNSIDGSGSVLELELTGNIPEGLTVCAALDPADEVLSVTLDGTAVPWELRSGGRLFSVIPETGYGEHTVSITIDPLGIENGDREETLALAISLQSPCSGENLSVNVTGIPPGRAFNVQVLDITGRVISSQNEIFSGSPCTVSFSRPLPSGVYFVTVSSGDIMASARTVVTTR